MIETTLNKEAASALFKENAIFFYTADAVPEYRIYELFGPAAAAFYDRNRNCDRLFKGGRDYDAIGDCSQERPQITYFMETGFMQFVSYHNYLMAIKEAKQSEGGKLADGLRMKWGQELEAEENAARAK